MGGWVPWVTAGFIAMSAQAVTFRDIEAWTRRGEVKSVEDVLRRLPQDYRSRFVLMERSRSLQEASPVAPRAILFGDRAELTLAFNGEPGQRGFGQLESVELDPRTLAYEIRTIDFTATPARISPPNPAVCVKCHRQIPRPNWEPYPYWPGALGEWPRYTAEERRRLENFVKSAPSHPLYRHLDFRHSLSRRTSSAFDLYTLYTEVNLERNALLLKDRSGALASLADCPPAISDPDMIRRFRNLASPYHGLLTSAVASVMAKLRAQLAGFPVDVLPTSFSERFFLTASGSYLPQLISKMTDKAPLAALSAYFQPSTRPYGAAEKRAHADFCATLTGGKP